MIFRAILVALGLVAANIPASANDGLCARRVLQTRPVIVCTVDMSRQTIRTLWKSPQGEAYGSLAGIDKVATLATGPMLMAMNAGMYHADLTPVGLYIENGATQHPVVTGGGPGNFHLRPNGVFTVSGRNAGVVETRRFVASRQKAEFASQSGPMLVIDGKLHPAFTGQGTSEKIRNGVGVAGRTAYFVITEQAVTFTEFARMFRDDLKARNALYFDGSISSLYAPSVGRADRFMPVGPIVAVFAR